MKKIIDRSALLHNPAVLSQEDMFITIRCVEDLDRASEVQNTSARANAARKSIIANQKTISIINERRSDLSLDDEVLFFASRDGDLQVITDNLSVYVKADYQHIPCEYVQRIAQQTYTGSRELYLEFDKDKYNEQLDLLLQTREPLPGMCNNECLICYDKNDYQVDKFGEIAYTPICIFINKEGKLKQINKQYINSDVMTKISARNAKQSCLVEMLKDDDIKIILATGQFGVGKSLLTTAYALDGLKTGLFNKIIYVPNNSFNANTREVGTLPGELFEKEYIHMGTLIDLIGLETIRQMIDRGLIEIAPVSVARGRNFERAIILVNEAQNLTEDHIKLLVARCSEGAKICFDGDIKQTDQDVFKERNGLILLSKLRNSSLYSKIFGMVKLDKVERSLTAQAASYLDSIS